MRCVTRVARRMRESATTGLSMPPPAPSAAAISDGGIPRNGTRSAAVTRPSRALTCATPADKRRRIRRSVERQRVEQDRARVVAHEEAVHLFGRMRRPPSDDADPASRRRREVPDRRHRARVAGDRHLAARGRVDLLEIEHAMDVRRHARRLRRPEDGREQRKLARQLRGVALGRQALPVRHRAFRGKAIHELPVQTVEADPDHRPRETGRAPCARRHVRRIDGRAWRGRRRRLFATAREPGAEDERGESEKARAPSHRPHHNKGPRPE